MISIQGLKQRLKFCSCFRLDQKIRQKQKAKRDAPSWDFQRTIRSWKPLKSSHPRKIPSKERQNRRERTMDKIPVFSMRSFNNCLFQLINSSYIVKNIDLLPENIFHQLSETSRSNSHQYEPKRLVVLFVLFRSTTGKGAIPLVPIVYGP